MRKFDFATTGHIHLSAWSESLQPPTFPDQYSQCRIKVARRL